MMSSTLLLTQGFLTSALSDDEYAILNRTASVSPPPSTSGSTQTRLPILHGISATAPFVVHYAPRKTCFHMPESAQQTSGRTDFHSGTIASTKKTLKKRLARDLGNFKRPSDDKSAGSNKSDSSTLGGVTRSIPAECLYNFQ
ncbi:hypothetical protein FPV67DRAFT_382570 [Lyophyllum atratum]|nr:hypothetical protein FPV67DRAFT_382570 [Lyophyllum atratum]